MSKTPTKINDYLVLPVSLPASKCGVDSATHYLYLRRHAPKVPTPDDARSLFVVNVPIDATEAHLRGLFSGIGGGRVESVFFEGEEKKKEVVALADSKKRKRIDEADVEAAATVKTWDRELRKSGSTAVVMFVDKPSAEMTLKAAAKANKSKKQDSAIKWGGGISDTNKIPALGISRYLTHHNLRFPSKAALQVSTDAFMSIFNEQEAENARALARRRQEPDEDGFVTVVRGGRVAPARHEEAAEVAKKKEAKGDHKGFYRFQTREVRKEKHQQLLAKFELDKKKVAERKNMRKFKPL